MKDHALLMPASRLICIEAGCLIYIHSQILGLFLGSLVIDKCYERYIVQDRSWLSDQNISELPRIACINVFWK